MTPETLIPRHTGGSFAPPLTEELLGRYEALAASASPEISGAMNELLACCREWWNLPESGPDGSVPHPVGRGTIVPLDKPIADALEAHIPWKRELDGMAQLFEGIDANSQKELRDAAFHCLWVCRELEIGREPLTSDKF